MSCCRLKYNCNKQNVTEQCRLFADEMSLSLTMFDCMLAMQTHHVQQVELQANISFNSAACSITTLLNVQLGCRLRALLTLNKQTTQVLSSFVLGSV